MQETLANQIIAYVKSFDKDGNGWLDREELRAFLGGGGGPVPADELTRAIDDLDTDRDGRVSLEELKKFLLS